MRVIARLDTKPPYVVKPVYFEGLRKIGEPKELAEKYYRQGADEIFYIDIVASLYQRDIKFDLAYKTSKELFIPFAVGGGIKNIDHVKRLIHNGADKVIVNTNAIDRPELIQEIAQTFGSQAVAVHIQAKKWDDWYECYTDCGRNRSGVDAVEWAKQAEDMGAGEILLSTIDKDGAQKGFDLNISEQVLDAVNIPVVIGSGAGSLDDILHVARLNPSGVAVGSILHYDTCTIKEVKEFLKSNDIEVYI